MGLPGAGCAPNGLETPRKAEEIEIGGGAICTVMVGWLSSEEGAPEADGGGACANNGAASRHDSSESEAALKKRRLIP
jgi:hypothetical protein